MQRSFTGNLNATGTGWRKFQRSQVNIDFTDTNDGLSNPNFTVSADGANGICDDRCNYWSMELYPMGLMNDDRTSTEQIHLR